MIDLRRFSPIRVHVHRRPADAGPTSLTLPPARSTARDPLARRALTGPPAQVQLATTETLGGITAYDDDWFAGRPATP